MPIGPSVTLADARVPLHIKPNRGSPVSNNAFHGNGSNLPIKQVHIPVLPLATVNNVPVEHFPYVKIVMHVLYMICIHILCLIKVSTII